MKFARKFARLLALGLFVLSPVLARRCLAGEAKPESDLIQATFQKACVRCHGEAGEVNGEVNLLQLGPTSELTKHPELLEKIVEAIEFEVMPPADEPPLPKVTRRRLLMRLQELLKSAQAANQHSPHVPIRRMNRFQYNNAVRDLFQLNVDVFALPERMMREHDNYFQPETGKMPDIVRVGSRPLGKSQLIGRRLAGVAPFPQDLRAEHGFDNRADHLSLSPLLMESFLKLGRSIVRSEDFNASTCGIWNDLFAAPAEPASEAILRCRLRDFLTTAFRRPVPEPALERYVAFAMAHIDAGQPFSEAMKETASAVLASPRFLYLYDEAAAESPQEHAADFDLASRLSFFLWGSIPDKELLALAEKGTLHKPDILAQQVDRMLNDHRLKRFCDSFPSQWLQLERIIASVPDRDQFPEFYFAKFRVSMHMMLEPLLLFETVLVENRSVLQLIDSDFSYRSELLDAWYESGQQSGRKPPTVIPFHRVDLSDRRQGGVITNAAVMTMTSGTTRTKPITRGAWIASVIFNDPPEPPPADVPPLSEDDRATAQDLTLRERLEAHRDQASCAGCHVKIDPLGFAMENYGPIGFWRETYPNGRTVDASGVLFGQHPFDEVSGFKDAMLAEKARFVRGFASHLLAFALGREVGFADRAALQRVVEWTASDDYRLRTMIKQIALSEPFRRTE